jgi:hypothetical protein
MNWLRWCRHLSHSSAVAPNHAAVLTRPQAAAFHTAHTLDAAAGDCTLALPARWHCMPVELRWMWRRRHWQLRPLSIARL